jgi:hypothetical protein
MSFITLWCETEGCRNHLHYDSEDCAQSEPTLPPAPAQP